MFSVSLTNRLTRPGAANTRKRGLRVEANTLWSLTPDKKWCEKKPECCKKLAPVDLTEAIGAKRLVSVGSAHLHTEEPVDFVVLDHGGIHVLFEAEGKSKPLDSPSVLFMTDIDSECDVRVDGEVVPKGQRTRLHPGASLSLGEEVCYQVLRNVHAHA